jgi:hypothetical protein
LFQAIKAVQGIAIHSNDILFVDRSSFAVTVQLVDAACQLNYAGLFEICLRPVSHDVVQAG